MDGPKGELGRTRGGQFSSLESMYEKDVVVMVVSNDSTPKMVAVPNQMLNELRVASLPPRQPRVLEMSVSLGEDGLPIMQSFVLLYLQG